MEDADKLKDHVGRRIAEIRERKGLSQADVAEMLRTTVSNLQRIEYGTQNVTIETLVKIANALGVAVIEFFGSLDTPKRRRTPGRPRRSR